MSNMIQAAREQVAALTQAAYERAAAEGLLPAGAEVKATIEIPKDVTHGDYASSFAMAGAKALRKAPRQIASSTSSWPLPFTRRRWPTCWPRGRITAAPTTARGKRCW